MEKGQGSAEVLIPMAVTELLGEVRTIVREEVRASMTGIAQLQAKGLVEKPIYSMDEVRRLFDGVSRSTIYEWIEEGLLKPKKMKGKIFFLWRDIEAGWENIQ